MSESSFVETFAPPSLHKNSIYNKTLTWLRNFGPRSANSKSKNSKNHRVFGASSMIGMKDTFLTSCSDTGRISNGDDSGQNICQSFRRMGDVQPCRVSQDRTSKPRSQKVICDKYRKSANVQTDFCRVNNKKSCEQNHSGAFSECVDCVLFGDCVRNSSYNTSRSKRVINLSLANCDKIGLDVSKKEGSSLSSNNANTEICNRHGRLCSNNIITLENKLLVLSYGKYQNGVCRCYQLQQPSNHHRAVLNDTTRPRSIKCEFSTLPMNDKSVICSTADSEDCSIGSDDVSPQLGSKVTKILRAKLFGHAKSSIGVHLDERLSKLDDKCHLLLNKADAPSPVYLDRGKPSGEVALHQLDTVNMCSVDLCLNDVTLGFKKGPCSADKGQVYVMNDGNVLSRPRSCATFPQDANLGK